MDRQTFTIVPFEQADEEQVIALWERCELVVPWNNPRHDIRRKLRIQPDLFLVGRLDSQVIATVMAGYEGHRGWLNYLAVGPDYRRRGIGRRIVEEATRRLRELGCPKINLQIRASNRVVIAFYEQLGFMIDDVVSMGKRLE